MLYFTRSEMTRSRSNNPFLLARRASALARDYYRFYDGVPSRGFPSLARFEVALSDAMWIHVLASEPIPRKGSGVRHPPVFTIARPFASLFLGICL